MGGKSSLLDAFTWSLFSESRGKGTDVINLNQDVKAAEVVLTFEYEAMCIVFSGRCRGIRVRCWSFRFGVGSGRRKAEDGRQRAVGEGGRWHWGDLGGKDHPRYLQARIEQTLAS